MTDPEVPRPSSTVVLARPGVVEPEVFMVRRHEQASFGAAYAFPGGVVDPEDGAVHDWCRGVSAHKAEANLGLKGNALDYYSAAVRELFEETGVLLANPDEVAEGAEAARDALNDGSDRWDCFVRRNELELHCGDLHYFSHWITPPGMPKRYSTRFFVAALPAGQQAGHCGGELTDSRWSTAHDMLAAGRAGEVELHFPTIKTLESVARYKTFDELIDWASACAEWGVTTMLAMIVERDGKKAVSLPGEADYPGYVE